MNETEAALEFAENIIHQTTDTYCSELQRQILIAALQQERKTYDQIAKDCGYSDKYVKQDVAPKLWQLLSQALGEKVTKANVRSVIKHNLRTVQNQRFQASSGLGKSSLSAETNVEGADLEGADLEGAEASSVVAGSAALSERALLSPFMDSGLDSELDSALASEQRANILLVDDQPKNLQLLTELLEEQGYEVQQAINGTVALQAIAHHPPDLVLLDIHLPEMDGYTVCQKIKANPTRCDIPVIFVSALDDPWDKVKAFSVGGCDYIAKPFKVVEVLARVENQLKIRQLQQRLINQNIRLQQAIQELQRLAAIDELTQVASRRRFDAYLLDCWHRAKAHKQPQPEPLTLVLVQVHDLEYGRDGTVLPKQDRTLYKIAQLLQLSIGTAENLVARYGTMTFAVVLPGQTKAQGEQLIAHFLQQIEKSQALSGGLPDFDVTVGTKQVIPAADTGIEAFLEMCDLLLERLRHRNIQPTVE